MATKAATHKRTTRSKPLSKRVRTRTACGRGSSMLVAIELDELLRERAGEAERDLRELF